MPDDSPFDDFTALWRERGHGGRSIRYKLRQRGLPAELAASAVSATQDQEEDSAVSAIESRLYALLREQDPRKRRAKALRFLAARGFAGDAVGAAMRRLKEASADNDPAEDQF